MIGERLRIFFAIPMERGLRPGYIIAQFSPAGATFSAIFDFRVNAQFSPTVVVNMTKRKVEICYKIPLSFWAKT